MLPKWDQEERQAKMNWNNEKKKNKEEGKKKRRKVLADQPRKSEEVKVRDRIWKPVAM